MSDNYEMVVPVVHLNGTSLESLAVGFANPLAHVRAAIDDLQANPPNMRDYYVHPDGDSAFRKACAQHELRISRLRDVAAELSHLREEVLAQKRG